MSDLGYTVASTPGDGDGSAGLAAHEADTTNVHGIADTALLETVTGAQTKADTAQAAAITAAATAADARHDRSILPADHGLLAWSVPIDFATTGSLMSVEVGAGVLRLSRIRRAPVANVTYVNAYVTTLGASLSNCYAALYTAAGALVGQTADQSTAWQTAGWKQMALVGGPLPITAGDYYVGLWYNGTTAPTMQRSGIGSGPVQINLGQASADYSAAYANTGLTTTAPATIGAKTSSALHFWVAIS